MYCLVYVKKRKYFAYKFYPQLFMFILFIAKCFNWKVNYVQLSEYAFSYFIINVWIGVNIQIAQLTYIFIII